MPIADACFVCGGKTFAPLPDPNPNQCMMSDFHVLHEPLGKRMCLSCGAGNRASRDFHFDDSYDLYAHAIGDPFETQRQTAYAQWLGIALGDVGSIFEAGAGNGSFLDAFRRHRPDCKVSGVEPAPEAAKVARDAGFDVETAYLQSSAARADAAIAINVIEHTPDPRSFLSDLASYSNDLVAVVCPNGDSPNSELLVADHVSSFARANIRALMADCGLNVADQIDAPAAIGKFFLTIGSRNGGRATQSPAPEQHRFVESLFEARTQYLNAWRSIDAHLERRLENVDNVGAFGVGEASALLRAYAPRSWARIEACYVDAPRVERFGDLPVYDASEKLPGALILGVRPQAQGMVAERLSMKGVSCIRWDDVIAA